MHIFIEGFKESNLFERVCLVIGVILLLMLYGISIWVLISGQAPWGIRLVMLAIVLAWTFILGVDLGLS